MDPSAGRLREQILAGENDINTLSGFAADGRLRLQQVPPQPSPAMAGGYPVPSHYSNHDVMTPVTDPYSRAGVSSRKGSMTSQSARSMHKLFGRKKGDPVAGFDDDEGADMGDVGSVVSFQDIRHLRGTGTRYNTNSAQVWDTSPIIPVLGVGAGGLSSTKNLSGMQYRQMMNHQKKVNLAQGARANSLAGGNPMAPLHSMTSSDFRRIPDDRAMSMGANGRAMSLGGQSMGMGGPRTMLLNSNAMLNNGQRPRPGMKPMMASPPQAHGFHNQGPGKGHLVPNGQYVPNGQTYVQYPSGQHPGISGPAPGHGPGPGPGPYGPRAMSLRNGPPQGYPVNYQAQQFQGQTNQGPNFQLHGQSQHFQNMQPQNPAFQLQNPQFNSGRANPRINSLPGGTNTYQPPVPRHSGPQVSNDSLTNVVEEEEDAKLLIAEERDTFNDEDHVYKFDEAEGALLSRKSTIKRTNSARVRRLNLFNKSDEQVNEEDLNEVPQQAQEGKTVAQSEPVRELYYDSQDEDALAQREDQSRKLADLGVSNTDKDIYSTAPEFRSPEKRSKELPATPPQDRAGSVRKPIKIRSLTTNTAFNNFRTASGATIPDDASKSPPALNEPAVDKIETDSDSQTSTNSTGTTKANSESPSTEEHLHSSISKTDTGAIDGLDTAKSLDTVGDQPEVPSEESVQPDIVHRRLSSLSRSGSQLKMQGLLPNGGLIDSELPLAASSEVDLRPVRTSRNSSFSSKSRNLINRLSRSGLKKNINDDLEDPILALSAAGKQRNSSYGEVKKTPLVFKKEELAIMTCNNDLQNELQMVTTELAMSIKRELALEAQLRHHGDHENFHKTAPPSAGQQTKAFVELQEKLNNERRLRFISEEHAILAEHGQSPSALKLDYEKNEVYKQLLAKTDIINQLQDRVDELEAARGKNDDEDLLHKYNEMLKENMELKDKLGEMKKKNSPSVDYSGDAYHDGSNQAEALSLRFQRDELREMITKMRGAHGAELKVAQDKIRVMAAKLEDANKINEMMSVRLERSGDGRFSPGPRLQGLDVVSPTRKLFDDR